MRLDVSSRLLRVVTIVIFLGLAYAAVLHKYGVQGWLHYRTFSPSPGPAEANTGQAFLADGTPDRERYQALVDYFFDGAFGNTDRAGSRIQFPGAPSMAGYKVNGLEGFARAGSLMAAWIASGRDPVIVDQSTGQKVDLVGYLRRGLLEGVDPSAHGYWGTIRPSDQRIVESADIARIVWMTRAQIWEKLLGWQQALIVDWLQKLDGVATPTNVWLLFPVTVDAVLRSLGQPGFPAYAAANYAKFKHNYRGNGWFNDPPEGVDYYNAWGVDYELFWIAYVDPQLDHDYIQSIMHDSADVDAHLISPVGVPMMGRSICYRTAVPVPMLAANLLGEASVSPGYARRGLDATWRYFVAHGALQDGTLTQGYFGNDLRFLDLYSGAGSCAWGLRSLVLAYLHAPDSDFWKAPPEPLPVERADYRMTYEKLGWVVSGTRASGDITIDIPRNEGAQPKIVPYSNWRHLLEPVLCRPFRPPNGSIAYDKEQYSAIHPFVEDR